MMKRDFKTIKEYQDYRRLKNLQNKALKKKRAAIPKQSNRNKYLSYITSKKWKEKKSRIISIRGNFCEICRSSYSLNLHHLNYKRLFNELDSDLQLLCSNCHSNSHEGKNGIVCDPITKEYLSRMSGN